MASEEIGALIQVIIRANIEVLGLLIQDLEFHRNGIWIRRRSGLENGALAKSLAEGEERFIDLSPALMALLDHLLLQHGFDTDHLFVVLKRNAKDKWGNSTYGHPLDREAVKGLFRYYSQKSNIPILMRDYTSYVNPRTIGGYPHPCVIAASSGHKSLQVVLIAV